MVKRTFHRWQTLSTGKFTLIEALFTVAVLAVGTVFILTSFNSAAKRNLTMQEYDNVCALASRVNEELNSAPQPTFSPGNNGNVSHGDFPGYYTSIFARKENLFTHKSYENVEFYDITITVTAPNYNQYYFKTGKLVRK